MPTCYLAIVSQKLHENEEILGQRRGRVSLKLTLRSATAIRDRFPPPHGVELSVLHYSERLKLILKCCSADTVVQKCSQGNQNTLTLSTKLKKGPQEPHCHSFYLTVILTFFQQIPFHPENYSIRNCTTCFPRGTSISDWLCNDASSQCKRDY